jgi:transposase
MAVKDRRSSAAVAEPGAVAQIRTAIQDLIAEGRTDEALEYCLAALSSVVQKASELERLLAKMRRQQLGLRSERIPAEQLALLLEELRQQETPEPLEPAGTEAEERADATLEQGIEAAEKRARERGKAARPRSRNWEAHRIERAVHHVDLPPEERTCFGCGREKRRIGEDITRTLEYVPAHFREHEYRRAKYACGACKDGVTTAPGPVKIIERSTADASVLAQVVVSKFADHLPLHRQNRIYRRAGVHIPVSTLSDWVAGVADRLEPLVDVLATRVLSAHVVGTDATGLKVLEPRAKENIHRGTMWCYVGDERDVVLRYTPTGEGETGPWQFLGGRKGYIQADAAGVFDRLYNGQKAAAIEVGCWAHARRKFVALAETDCRVARPLQLIRRVYRLEYLADLEEYTLEQRTAMRNERSRDALDKLKRWLLVTAEQEPPGSELAKAVNYCLRHWRALTRFLDDARLSPDNNVVEQQLRDVALGRKNYLFAGSHDAARRIATIYSILRTCTRHGVPPLPYLTDVLRKLAHGWEESRLAELLPGRWQQLHAEPASSSAAASDLARHSTTVV